jgi:23S rRNA U2552 (ribose-2'-O)-methylase RlmE/FtsJ
MKSLREIFEAHNDRLLHKWNHYIEIYDRHFSSFRGREIVFVEIGVAHGGSLQMWREYFGEKAKIIGVDINPECKKFEEKNTEVIVGSQEDPKFLETLKDNLPSIDIFIDDGGHTMKQQVLTFKYLYDKVKLGGLYLCEDLHTSYWYEYGGGLKNKKSFIEFSKTFIDYLHGWHVTKKHKREMLNVFTKTIYALHFYNSILVIEKREINKPTDVMKGERQLSYHYVDYGQRRKLKDRILLWIKPRR